MKHRKTTFMEKYLSQNLYPGHNLPRLVLASIIICGINIAIAGNLYKWVDSGGNVTYQDTPPSSDVSFENQSYNDPDSELKEEVELTVVTAAEENPITFYSILECDPCDLVRLYLEKHALPFAEKDIQSNVTVQQELQLRAGQLKVPTLIVGDEVIDDYSKNAMRRLLAEKGYPMEQLENNGTKDLGSTKDEEFEETAENDFGDQSAELENLEDQVLLDGTDEFDSDTISEIE